MIGTQEIIALILVTAIVGFALYRRWRKKSGAAGACSGCEHSPAKNNKEKTVHFFKKQD